MRRSGSRPRVHGPPAQRARPLGDAAARRRHHARGDQRPDPRRQLHLAAAPLQAQLLGPEEDHAAAEAFGHRGVLSERGLRHRGAHPAAARR